MRRKPVFTILFLLYHLTTLSLAGRAAGIVDIGKYHYINCGAQQSANVQVGYRLEDISKVRVGTQFTLRIGILASTPLTLTSCRAHDKSAVDLIQFDNTTILKSAPLQDLKIGTAHFWLTEYSCSVTILPNVSPHHYPIELTLNSESGKTQHVTDIGPDQNIESEISRAVPAERIAIKSISQPSAILHLAIGNRSTTSADIKESRVLEIVSGTDETLLISQKRTLVLSVKNGSSYTVTVHRISVSSTPEHLVASDTSFADLNLTIGPSDSKPAKIVVQRGQWPVSAWLAPGAASNKLHCTVTYTIVDRDAMYKDDANRTHFVEWPEISTEYKNIADAKMDIDTSYIIIGIVLGALSGAVLKAVCVFAGFAPQETRRRQWVLFFLSFVLGALYVMISALLKMELKTGNPSMELSSSIPAWGFVFGLVAALADPFALIKIVGQRTGLETNLGRENGNSNTSTSLAANPNKPAARATAKREASPHNQTPPVVAKPPEQMGPVENPPEPEASEMGMGEQQKL